MTSMAESKPKDRAEEENPDITRSPEYKRFKKLLRKVVKAPPMRDHPGGPQNKGGAGEELAEKPNPSEALAFGPRRKPFRHQIFRERGHPTHQRESQGKNTGPKPRGY